MDVFDNRHARMDESTEANLSLYDGYLVTSTDCICQSEGYRYDIRCKAVELGQHPPVLL